MHKETLKNKLIKLNELPKIHLNRNKRWEEKEFTETHCILHNDLSVFKLEWESLNRAIWKTLNAHYNYYITQQRNRLSLKNKLIKLRILPKIKKYNQTNFNEFSYSVLSNKLLYTKKWGEMTDADWNNLNSHYKLLTLN